jgi:hypothetical protein
VMAHSVRTRVSVFIRSGPDNQIRIQDDETPPNPTQDRITVKTNGIQRRVLSEPVAVNHACRQPACRRRRTGREPSRSGAVPDLVSTQSFTPPHKNDEMRNNFRGKEELCASGLGTVL